MKGFDSRFKDCPDYIIGVSKEIFSIYHQIGRDDPQMPPRASVRWSLTGRHDGWGSFGAPTGAEVYVMGISHGVFGSLGVAAPTVMHEFSLIDETAVWKQIHLHHG